VGIRYADHATPSTRKSCGLRPRSLVVYILGSGVQLGPLGTAATNRCMVPAPDDYDDGEIGGMMIARGNLPQCRFVQHKPHTQHGREPGPPRWEASD
jgi:hypothetical protein